MRKVSGSALYLLLWNVINVCLFVGIIAFKSTVPEVLNRYTHNYALGIALCLVVAGFVACFTIFASHRPHLPQAISSRFVAYFGRICRQRGQGLVVMLPVLLASIVVWSLPIDGRLIKVFFSVNIACFGIYAGTTLKATETQSFSRKSYLPYYLLLFILLFAGLFSAYAVPEEQSSGDEASWTNYALTWLQTGNIYLRIVDVPPVPIAPGLGYSVTIYARWIEHFGIGIGAGRVFIWVVYALGVCSIGLAGRKLFGNGIGIVSALLAASSPLLLQSRIIRPEIGLPIVGALVFLTYMASQERVGWAFFSGLLPFWGLEIHAAGIAYVISVAGLYSYDALSDLRAGRKTPQSRFWVFALGALVGGLVYTILHISVLSQPSYFFESLRSERQFLSGFSLLTSVQILTKFWAISPVELILFLIGLVGLALRRTTQDKLLLRFMIFTAAGYLLVVPGADRYLPVFVPFISWSIGALLRYGFQRRLPSLSSLSLALGAIVVFWMSGEFLAISVPKMALGDPMPVQQVSPIGQRIRVLADNSSVVVGNIRSYWDFIDYPRFYAWELEFWPGKQWKHEDPYGPWPEIAPDVVFFSAYSYIPQMPPLLERYLRDMQYRLVSTFETNGVVTRVWWKPAYEDTHMSILHEVN